MQFVKNLSMNSQSLIKCMHGLNCEIQIILQFTESIETVVLYNIDPFLID